MAEWLKATDCKSVPARVRWFESTSAHIFYKANCDATRPMSKIKALSVRSAHAVALSKRKARRPYIAAVATEAIAKGTKQF